MRVVFREFLACLGRVIESALAIYVAIALAIWTFQIAIVPPHAKDRLETRVSDVRR